MLPDAYLSSIGQALGEQRDIASLDGVARFPTLELLREEGYEHFLHSDSEPWELAARSAAVSLDRWGQAVDLVVYCTNTLRTRHDRLRSADLLTRLGLPQTQVIGVTMNGCGNLGAGIRTALSAIYAGNATAALVVTSDTGVDDDRVVPPGVGVRSDGAASCVVSTLPPNQGFLMRGTGGAIDARIYALEAGENRMSVTKAAADGLRRAVRQIYQRGGTTPDSVSHLVTHNYVDPVLGLFANMARLSEDVVYTPTLAAVGHCYAADPLINLAMLEAEPQPPSGTVLMLSAGRHTWTYLALDPLHP
jgi:3-oxoacyl-[acyl-carrier-protein] synthase-3